MVHAILLHLNHQRLVCAGCVDSGGSERREGETWRAGPCSSCVCQVLYSSFSGAWGERDHVMSITRLCYYYILTHELQVFISGAANVFALLNVLRVHWVGSVN